MPQKMKIVVLGTRGIPDIQGRVERHCQNLYPGISVTVTSRVTVTREVTVTDII